MTGTEVAADRLHQQENPELHGERQDAMGRAEHQTYDRAGKRAQERAEVATQGGAAYPDMSPGEII